MFVLFIPGSWGCSEWGLPKAWLLLFLEFSLSCTLYHSVIINCGHEHKCICVSWVCLIKFSLAILIWPVCCHERFSYQVIYVILYSSTRIYLRKQDGSGVQVFLNCCPLYLVRWQFSVGPRAPRTNQPTSQGSCLLIPSWDHRPATTSTSNQKALRMGMFEQQVV